eukprot:9675052-Lingulodinium_polyedra.AAC.1
MVEIVRITRIVHVTGTPWRNAWLSCQSCSAGTGGLTRGLPEGGLDQPPVELLRIELGQLLLHE